MKVIFKIKGGVSFFVHHRGRDQFIIMKEVRSIHARASMEYALEGERSFFVIRLGRE